MKNLVYIVAINMDVKENCIIAWSSYCKKHGCDFRVISESSGEKIAPHWERYNVMELYPDYDNYLYVDADAIVHWNAPNFFENLSEDHIYAVKDIGSLEWTYNSIEGYQDLFPDVKVNWWEYITTGFLKFNKSHKQLFKNFMQFYTDNLTEINTRQYQTLRKGFDQTPFNYFIRKEDYKFEIISEVYSLGHLIKKDIFHNGMFINIPAYIWQFNGMPKDQLPGIMNQIWQHIKEKY